MMIEKYNHQKEKDIQLLGQRLHHYSIQFLSKNNNDLQNISQRIKNSIFQYIMSQQNFITQIQTKIELLHPDNILKRGYSITMKSGKVIRDTEEVEEGELMITKVYKGEIQSVVKK